MLIPYGKLKKGFVVVALIAGIVVGYGTAKTAKLMKEYQYSTEVYAELSSKAIEKEEKDIPAGEEREPVVDEEIGEEYPESSPISIDFSEMKGAEGRGTVSGWLYMDDSPINYPIMYSGDNVYYLDHLWNGEANASGTPFIDVRNADDFSDRNTIIYGHHMANKTMFGSLDYYLKKDYSDAHPSMYLNTPDKNYRLDFAGCYITNSESDAFEVFFDSDSDFADYKNTASSRFVNSSDIEITAEDRIVTLVTCNYSYNNARLICIFRMTRIG